MDFRVIPLIALLMVISLLILSSMTMEIEEFREETLFTPWVKSQLQWFLLGWFAFFLFAFLDYHKWYEWAGILYVGMILILLGLYITQPIQSVHRWYRLPGIGLSIQPSEQAKLIVVMTLGWFLEKKAERVGSLTTAFQFLFIIGIPFILILKQPDLGTALVLYPIAIIMGYFSGIHKYVMHTMSLVGGSLLLVVSLVFSGLLSHEEMKPFFSSAMKEYQYERLNPSSYHQKSAQIAIALGGWTGMGWHKSEFAGHRWLPAAHTDSVFAAFGEEFGFCGILLLFVLFYALIYFSFQVVLSAKDRLGKLLASGIAIYLAMHMMVNVAMMLGFLPISGVPLVLMSYGGSSVVTTMASLGILQSIYMRRFRF